MSTSEHEVKRLLSRGKVRSLTYCIVGSLGLSFVLWVTLSPPSRLIAKGPPNTGHDALNCEDCHRVASGEPRQRAQAIVRSWLGLREHSVSPVYERVNNQRCAACHHRDADMHAPHLFNEPRFKEARAAADPRRCVTCHAEHQGVRVTRDGTECRYCHQELSLRSDPLSPSHEQLAEAQEWGGCLGCHDYHGGHSLQPPERNDQAIGRELIDRYLRGEAPSPYGPPLNSARRAVP